MRPPAGYGCTDLLYVSSTDVALACFEIGVAGRVLFRLDPRLVATDAPSP